MATFTELKTEIARYGGMGTGTADTTSVEAWAKGGLRMIGRAAPWPWLRMHFSWALTAGTYNYALRTISTRLWRVDTQSFRFGGTTTYLQWGTPQAIDERLEPSWKDASGGTGTPQFICRVGVELWVAGKPSTAHVAAYPSIYGYGWSAENISADPTINGGHLLLPEEYFEVAVECSLGYGYHEEDDPRAETFLGRFRNVHLPEMLATLDPGADRRMLPPAWSYERYDTADNYGDGYR